MDEEATIATVKTEEILRIWKSLWQLHCGGGQGGVSEQLCEPHNACTLFITLIPLHLT